MSKGEIACNVLLIKIIGIYKKSDFWAKKAKQLYPIILLFKPRIHWAESIIGFISEFSFIENNYGTILESTGETCIRFLSRLTNAMKLKNQISPTEEKQFIDFFISLSTINVPDNPYAQALIFKACLEIGRHRPSPPKIFSFNVFTEVALTVNNLLEYPLEKPLPKVAFYNTMLMSTNDFSLLCSSADYHLFASHYLGYFQYHKAISEIAQNHLNMEDAYEILSSKTNRSDSEETFIDKYKQNF